MSAMSTMEVVTICAQTMMVPLCAAVVLVSLCPRMKEHAQVYWPLSN